MGAFVLYLGLSLVVLLPLVDALHGARRATDRKTRRFWRMVAVAALLAHPYYLMVTVGSVVSVLWPLVRTSKDGGTLYLSASAAPLMLSAATVAAVVALGVLALGARRFPPVSARVAMVSIFFAIPLLALFGLITYLAHPQPRAQVRSPDGRYRLSSLEFDEGCAIRVEWPGLLPIVAEEAYRHHGWLDGCPRHDNIVFGPMGTAEFRYGDTVKMTYVPGDGGVLPGAGGTVKW